MSGLTASNNKQQAKESVALPSMNLAFDINQPVTFTSWIKNIFSKSLSLFFHDLIVIEDI